MIKIENHKDIELQVRTVVESYDVNELACDDFKMSWQILKNACEQDDRSAFFVLPAVNYHLSNIQTNNIEFCSFIDAVKEINKAISVFLKSEKSITLEDLKELYGYVGFAFYIDRIYCADDISDELLNQILRKIYADNYLDIALKEDS